MQFGLFVAPFHKMGENPTLCYQRDLETVEWVERLGYDEVFIGEHHSAGWEIIPSPELFIAHAAARTRSIRLGTGVVSIPYHHPFNVAARIAFLDHLTRGRLIFGGSRVAARRRLYARNRIQRPAAADDRRG